MEKEEWLNQAFDLATLIQLKNLKIYKGFKQLKLLIQFSLKFCKIILIFKKIHL